ncbi:MAG: VWA domain-containing protein [Spirochaetes bacterium]|nr:MAG: VWA domain-containing protein [Spirochaetota bacterium]
MVVAAVVTAAFMLSCGGPNLGGQGKRAEKMYAPQYAAQSKDAKAGKSAPRMDMMKERAKDETELNTEEYDSIKENEFLDAQKNPLSTFSADVDTASYSNVRRFVAQNQMPPKGAVRVEEMLNYFTYEYPQPGNDAPFSFTTELAPCPWNQANRLLLIGLQAKKIPVEQMPPSNLVFLLDVSGSMNAANKLPLLKNAFKLLVNQLRAKDRVAIVVYAGAAGVVLPSTPGDKKDMILDTLENLRAGGSTAGGAGIQLAYAVAKENFLPNGNNRVVLATDGDFNVGASSNDELENMIVEKRKDGIFLTVLGFGMGNYKDAKMEKIADKGNGNFAYIDTIHEARKVLVQEMGATLYTIAKDVKVQAEFNPARVKAYRLVGYENRLMRAEEFNDDRKDAGELGSGHSVTVLYEITPAGAQIQLPGVDPLKYQASNLTDAAKTGGEIMTLKFRYKPPKSDQSILLTTVVNADEVQPGKESANLRYAAAVAQYGMLLRDSPFKGSSSYADVIERARAAQGRDAEGYRAEFIRLVDATRAIAGK